MLQLSHWELQIAEMRRSAELALAQENIQNEQSRLEFYLRSVSPSLKVGKWNFELILKKTSKELSFRRLSEIEKAKQRSRHSSCVCLCLYGLFCYFITLLTRHWHQVTVSAKCYQSGIVHVCTFLCATCVTFINYSHLYSSQNWALVLGRAHLPLVLFQVCFFVYTFVYLKHLGLYSFFSPHCYRMYMRHSYPCALLVHFSRLHSFLSQVP